MALGLDRRTRLFVVLAAVFTVSLVLGDLIGGKLLQTNALGMAFTISVGMIPFPITFLLTDLLNEFYGKRAARFVTWVGFAMALFTFAVLAIAVALPWAPFTREAGWAGMVEPSFNNVFSGSQRMLVASMVAYVFGQFADIAVFNFLKRVTRNRFLWLRATGSTVVSQLIDTVVIQTIAWYGLLDFANIRSLVFTSYLVKLAVAISLTPLIYAGHVLVQRWLGIAPVVLDAQGEAVEGDEAPAPLALETAPSASTGRAA